jgi:hypothetical protein
VHVLELESDSNLRPIDVDNSEEECNKQEMKEKVRKAKKVEFRQAVKAARDTAIKGSADELNSDQMPAPKWKRSTMKG